MDWPNTPTAPVPVVVIRPLLVASTVPPPLAGPPVEPPEKM
jgi:hypothetical protein